MFFLIALAHLFGVKIPGLYIYYNLNSYRFQDLIISALSFGWSVFFFSASKLPNKVLLRAILLSGIIAITILTLINSRENVSILSKIETIILFIYWLWLVYITRALSNKKML